MLGIYNTFDIQSENKIKTEEKKIYLDSYKASTWDIETWLNETLAECEHLDIPGIILEPQNKKPTMRYGVDRMELFNSGLSNEMIDRMYRQLFVHSFGFFETMKNSLSQLGKDRAKVL